MRRGLVVIALALVAGVSGLVAQQAGPSTYLIPPKAIVDILDTPPPPGVVASPTREVLALPIYPELEPSQIERVARVVVDFLRQFQ